MSIQYVFPFCVISNSGTAKTVKGSISITAVGMDIAQTVDFELVARTWQDQTPDSQVIIEMPDLLLYDSELVFDIQTKTKSIDAVVLVLQPTLVHAQTLDTYLMPVSQEVIGTEFAHKNIWCNLPLKFNQTAKVILRSYVQETPNTVVGHLADKITFRKTLTHIEKPATKDNLTIEENIEYYLGKDKLKNLYFNNEIPAAWTIPARIQTPAPIISASTTGFFPGDSIEYQYNNLGYRSTIDFIKDINEPVILCLGDSDSFGIGVEYENTWPSLIQQHTDAVVWNMSVPGISNDGLARIASQTIATMGNQIDAVLIHYAPMSLREFVSKKYKGGVHTHRNYNLPYADWWTHIDWQSNNYNFNKNKLLLEHTCAKYDIYYHDLYINRDDPKVPFDFVEYGVYSSIGPNTHKAIANYFIRKLDAKPSLFQTLQS